MDGLERAMKKERRTMARFQATQRSSQRELRYRMQTMVHLVCDRFKQLDSRMEHIVLMMREEQERIDERLKQDCTGKPCDACGHHPRQ